MVSDARTSEQTVGGSCSPVGALDNALVGASPSFRQMLTVLDAVAEKDCIVLLEGESGTGKELLARRIHERSPRVGAPFIPLNCAGVSETLFESQLFGHVKGAFTGASSETLGVVRAAEGGTLLLDEVGEVPLHLQPKLLRLLQEREVTPVGSAKPLRVNTRFVASTNRNLSRMVGAGEFRADLFHRLNIVRVEVPSLRERPEDIELLLSYYIELFAYEYNRPCIEISRLTLNELKQYHWPGNIRELRAYVERLYATNTVPLSPSYYQSTWQDGYHYTGNAGEPDHPSQPSAMVQPAPGRISQFNDSPSVYTLAYAEEVAIRKALDYAGWNRTEAANLLDIHRSTLIRKIQRYRIRRTGPGLED